MCASTCRKGGHWSAPCPPQPTRLALHRSMLVSALVGVYATYAEPNGWPLVSTHSEFLAPFTLTSFALSLLLLYKTNSAYGRWWEARTQLGTLYIVSRSIQRLVSRPRGVRSPSPRGTAPHPRTRTRAHAEPGVGGAARPRARACRAPLDRGCDALAVRAFAQEQGGHVLPALSGGSAIGARARVAARAQLPPHRRAASKRSRRRGGQPIAAALITTLPPLPPCATRRCCPGCCCAPSCQTMSAPRSSCC